MNRLIIITTSFYNFQKRKFVIGGLETYIKDLALLALKNNIDVHIFQGNNDNKKYEIVSQNIRITSFPIKKIMLKGKYQYIFDIVFDKYNDKTTKFIIATDQMDIKSNAPNVITIQHGIAFDIPGCMIKGFWRRTRWLQFANKILRCVRNVRRFYHTRNTVCVDYNYYNWLRTLGTIYPKYNLTIIPNYAFNFISKEALNGKLRQKSGIIKIVFARRFVDYRGTLLFANVIKQLIREYENLDITFAGEGPLKKVLECDFRDCANVHFTSFEASESIKFHFNYDIAVIPTIFSEGTSLSLCEAMASGCFPIVTCVGGMTNMILDGFNGFLSFPSENSFYNVMKKCIMLSNDDFNTIVMNAYNSSLMAFSKEIWENKWMNLLK